MVWSPMLLLKCAEMCADGETKPESYGIAAVAAPSDEARLEAYAAELEAR
jgi:hypothetical protein